MHQGLKPNGHHRSNMRGVNGVKLANAVMHLVLLHFTEGHSCHHTTHAYSNQDARLVSLTMCVCEFDDVTKQGGFGLQRSGPKLKIEKDDVRSTVMQFVEQRAVIQSCWHLGWVASKNPLPSHCAIAMKLTLPTTSKVESLHQDDWPVKNPVIAHSKRGLTHNKGALVKDAHFPRIAGRRTYPRWVLGGGNIQRLGI